MFTMGDFWSNKTLQRTLARFVLSKTNVRFTKGVLLEQHNCKVHQVHQRTQLQTPCSGVSKNIDFNMASSCVQLLQTRPEHISSIAWKKTALTVLWESTTCLVSLCRQKPELGLATAISPGGPCPGGLHLETGWLQEGTNEPSPHRGDP